MPELETVDFTDVEILKVGGPIFGKGSPPEGDYWTEDALRAMADADAELEGELNPPAKIGHADYAPAVGWLENIRYDDDTERLLADVKRVPKKLSKLIKAGAYRTRSVELSKIKSQTTGKTYEWVVTGMAWLGGKLPAVRSLDDAVKLYDGNPEPLRVYSDALDVEQRASIEYAEGDVAWDPDRGFEAIRKAVQEALPRARDDGEDYSLWVRDLALNTPTDPETPAQALGGSALLEEYDEGASKAFIAAFERDDANGDVTVAAREAWTEVEMAWVEAARSLADERPGKTRGRSDTRPAMDTKFTDEQRRKFAEATGLEADKVTDEMLATAGVSEPKADPDPDAEQRALEADERRREFEQKATAADDRSRKLEEDLHAERRRNFVSESVRSGRVNPSQAKRGENGELSMLEKLYDNDPEAARAFVAELPVNEDFVREYGSEEEQTDETPEQIAERENRSYAENASVRLGIPAEDLI